MSCGQKAWAEKCEEEAFEQTLAAFDSKTSYQQVNTIQSVIDSLQRISNTPEIALSKTNWIRLDGSIKSLKDLLC